MTTTKITQAGKWLAFMAFVTLILTYNIWGLFEDYHIYDIGMAISIMFLVWSIHLSANGLYRIFSLAFLLICMSNVIDELFFDPTRVSVNEYISATIILITVLYLYRRNARQGNY